MTKTQLVEELRKLQERGPELVTMTKEVESADSRTLFGRAERDFTKQALVRSFGAVRSAVGEELEKLLEQSLGEAAVLEELKNTIVLSRKELELTAGKEVAVRAITELVQEYGEKKKQLDIEVVAEIAAYKEGRRSREELAKREQEEYDYGLKRDRARDQEEWKSVAERRELALLEREEMWKGKEVRFAELLKSEERAPKEIERAVQECETEVTERLAVEHGQTLLAVQKEWGAEKALLELRLANLVDQLKKQSGDVVAMRTELDRATAKAQELALAVIAGGKQANLGPIVPVESGK